MNDLEMNGTNESSVEGTLAIVSPIKSTEKCNKFYEASLDLKNGNKMRVVSFNENFYDTLKQSTGRRIKFDNIKFEKSKYLGGVEIHMDDKTSFNFMDTGEEKIEKIAELWISIKQVKLCKKDENVNVKGNIINISGVKYVQIKGNRVKKVVCVMGDGTGEELDLVLWSGKGEDLNEGEYRAFRNLTVCCYGGNTYVKYSPYTSAEVIDSSDGEKPSTTMKFANVEVIGIDKLIIKKMCNACLEPHDDLKGQSVVTCLKCNAVTKASKLHMDVTCALRVKEEASTTQKVLQLESKIIRKMLGGSMPQSITEAQTKLLAIDNISVAVHHGEIVDIKF